MLAILFNAVQNFNMNSNSCRTPDSSYSGTLCRGAVTQILLSLVQSFAIVLKMRATY